MPPRLSLMFRAFASPNYRLFFGGQIVSLVGSWMSITATSWLVYRLTSSPMMLGVVGFAGQFPGFVMGPFAGAYLDRWDRHKVLIATQAMSLVQAFAMALLLFTGHISMPLIIFLSAFQGLVNAFDLPARQAFLISIVRKEDLANAIAVNSSMFNAARLAGPSLAGLIVATAGEAWCFLIDGVSFFAVIVALLAMKDLPPQVRAPAHHTIARQLREGWRYVIGFRPIRSLMALLAALCLFAVPFSVLMPVFADDVLGGGPGILGFLLTAFGGGALAGALWLATRPSVVGLGRVILVNSVVLGVGLIGFALSQWLWLSIAFLFVSGFGMMAVMAAANTVIQTIVDDGMRGRVLSFYTMAFLGTAPFGSLLAGASSSRLGAPATVVISGVFSLAAAAWFSRELPAIRAVVRPIYMKLGILPEIAVGTMMAEEPAVIVAGEK
jgi:MFS family permease